MPSWEWSAWITIRAGDQEAAEGILENAKDAVAKLSSDAQEVWLSIDDREPVYEEDDEI